MIVRTVSAEDWSCYKNSRPDRGSNGECPNGQCWKRNIERSDNNLDNGQKIVIVRMLNTENSRARELKFSLIKANKPSTKRYWPGAHHHRYSAGHVSLWPSVILQQERVRESSSAAYVIFQQERARKRSSAACRHQWSLVRDVEDDTLFLSLRQTRGFPGNGGRGGRGGGVGKMNVLSKS